MATGEVAVILTKPLQFMVAASIIEQESIAGQATLFVLDSFSGASGLVERYQETSQPWGSAVLMPTQASAYAAASDPRFSRVLTNCDVGVQFRKLLKSLRGKRISVYEEGVGTYRRDIYRPAKRAILNAVGIGVAFGGSRQTSDIYVYRPDEYRQAVGKFGSVPVRIDKALPSFVRENADILAHLFGTHDTGGGGAASLYLSNWEVDRAAIESIPVNGALYVKPHPHIRADQSPINGAIVLPGSIPAELVIMKLAASHEGLKVYHHGSSAAHYLADSGVEFIRL